MFKSAAALFFGLILGFAAGLFVGVAPWSALGQPSTITVVNQSTSPLTDVQLHIGAGEQVLQEIAPGAETVVQVDLDATVPLSAAFSCAGMRREFAAEDIRPFGDNRTITVLNRGQTVIVTHGSAAAVVESTPVDSSKVLDPVETAP